MPFDMTLVHWPTVVEFANALATIKRPAYVKGITIHNTYRPDESMWRGAKSMTSMRDTYIAKGWTSGPNLYLVAAAPNPTHRGVWQMTPITRPGTHAGACNKDHLGVEVCGDFDKAPPSAVQYNLLLLVTRLIMEQWGLPPESINVHRDCMPGRTCPGKFLTSDQIRADLRLTIPRPPPAPLLWQIVAPCIPLTARAGDSPLAATDALAPGDVVQVGDVTNGWAWISDRADTPPGIGFVPISYLRPI